MPIRIQSWRLLPGLRRTAALYRCALGSWGLGAKRVCPRRPKRIYSGEIVHHSLNQSWPNEVACAETCRTQAAEMPPSITRIDPVMKLASSDAK